MEALDSLVGHMILTRRVGMVLGVLDDVGMEEVLNGLLGGHLLRVLGRRLQWTI